MFSIEIKKEIIFSSTVFLFTFLFFWSLSVDRTKKDSSSGSKLVVVFRKDISSDAAAQIMKKTGNFFSSGQDSVPEKLLNETGPKYIIQVSSDQKSAELSRLKRLNEVYDVYESDLNFQND